MELICDKNICIASICETWLSDATNATTSIIKSYGYSILHDFRLEQRGGGVAVIFKKGLAVLPYKFDKSFQTFEFTAVWLKTGTTKIVLVTMYRPGALTSVFSHELDQLLSGISPNTDELILAGDLNIHFENNKGIEKQCLDVFKSYGLKKLVNEPTHIGGGSLDQIFLFSLNKTIDSSVKIEPLCAMGSDHFPVFCNFNVQLNGKYFKEIEVRRLRQINNESFSVDLKNILDSLFMDQQFGFVIKDLSTALQKLVDYHAPKFIKSISVVDKAPWFNKEYRELRKLRRQAERKKHISEEAFLLYKDLCKKASDLANTKKKEFFSNKIQQSKGNSRTLYKVVNKVLDKQQTNVLPETDDIECLAKNFNQFYVDKIEKIRDKMVPTNTAEQRSDYMSTPLFEFRPTNIDEIKDIIAECGIKCSPADMLPEMLLKENIGSLLPAIVDLVNLSLSSGSMDGVKLADIAPLIKDKTMDTNELNNYRPVSNLTFLGKLIERVVLRRLEEHMHQNNLDCPEQFAYKKHHSTETILLKITNDLLIAADEQTATVVLLLDLSAAFDTVDHSLLLKILKHEIGIKGTALSWFASFLKGRSQRIRLGHITSETITIKFGVPQGSVLGPVLFNIYIRSIYCYVKNLGFKIYGYADDHQLSKTLTPLVQVDILTNQLNECFSVIGKWMTQYYLQLNESKTEIIVFGSSRNLKNIVINGVNLISGTTIRFVSNVKNLGVQMDNHLNFDKQISCLKKKSFHTIRNLSKVRFLLNEEQMKLVVNSMVISCLDYCNCLYYGIAERLLDQLQVIQNAAAKLITRKYKYDHVGDDLYNLHWLQIRKRIIFKIALLAYKAVNGHAPVFIQDMFTYSYQGYTPRLMIPNINSRFGQRSFSFIGPKVFNNLPLHIITAENTTVFKKRLKTFLFELPMSQLGKLTT